ncbi:MAG: nucleotide exchange factor GrpE [Rikenellaceae bacterium]|jgi:molecular chaperone GrpE|nr:nucleotide exchange factor GrpE [Rikenellaceae bacterium]
MTKAKNNCEYTADQFDTDNQAGACDIPGPEGAAAATDTVADGSFEDGDNSTDPAGKADEWKDKYLRLSAEFDNFRKRTLREKMDLVVAGGEDVIKPLLGVMDDFDRAVSAMENARDVTAVCEGVVLIRQKFFDTLKGKGVSEIEAAGSALDTDLHDAVAQFPVTDPKMKGRIVDVVQKGYKLKDKVIRHSKVVVGE